MDPFWAAVAEFWWIGPTVIGAGALGWFGLREQRASRARRIELEAARADLAKARTAAISARTSARVARAQLARTQAERAAGRATGADQAAAKRAADRAAREVKAAAAAVKVHRAQVSAARAALTAAHRDPSSLPLPRLMAAHDTVVARWMEYETDPAKLIAFPTMSDGRDPVTAAYLERQSRAQWLRPASATARIQPADFTAYRDAVDALERAFERAEAEAWRRARAAGTVPPAAESASPADGADWKLLAQQAAQDVLTRASDALGRVLGSSGRGESGPNDSERDGPRR